MIHLVVVAVEQLGVYIGSDLYTSPVDSGRNTLGSVCTVEA